MLLGAAASAQAQAVNYHLIKTVPIPSAAGPREYFDDEVGTARRLP
jgi:hypothetical protein